MVDNIEDNRRRIDRRDAQPLTVVRDLFTNAQSISEHGRSRDRPYTGIGPHREDEES